VPNGAGKTTTIRMLLGLIAGSSGEIELSGRRVTRGSVDLAGVGAIVDKPGFYPTSRALTTSMCSTRHAAPRSRGHS
jgi:ABC-type multidrug transport system ATPase subunit